MTLQLLLFFLDDLTYYGFHRANHEVRFLWAGHVPHHNSQFYNYGTALRQGVGERCLKYLFWCPLALLGFDPVMIVTMPFGHVEIVDVEIIALTLSS